MMDDDSMHQPEESVHPEISMQASGGRITAGAGGLQASAALTGGPPEAVNPGPVQGGTADQFKGIPMRELISGPLVAVAESQQLLAATALNFYNKIAYEDDGKKTRLLEFDLDQPVETPTGISSRKIHVSAPFLGLVPVPSLLIDRVDVDFQMEVTDQSTSKSTDNAELTSSVTAKWFTTSVNITGKVSTSKENTRLSNQTAKYQVHVTATQQPRTEGLAKLMDIMASCISPMDGTGS